MNLPTQFNIYYRHKLRQFFFRLVVVVIVIIAYLIVGYIEGM